MRYLKSFIAGGVAAIATAMLYIGFSLALSYERMDDPSGLMGATAVGVTIGPFFLLLVALAFGTGFLWMLTQTSHR